MEIRDMITAINNHFAGNPDKVLKLNIKMVGIFFRP